MLLCYSGHDDAIAWMYSKLHNDKPLISDLPQNLCQFAMLGLNREFYHI